MIKYEGRRNFYFESIFFTVGSWLFRLYIVTTVLLRPPHSFDDRIVLFVATRRTVFSTLFMTQTEETVPDSG